MAGGRGPRWTLFLTNRSFIAQVVALIFALLEIFGVFLPIDAPDMAEIIGLAGYLVAQGWSVWERLRGKTRGIWNGDQARKALEEADALSKALRDAGAR